MAFIAAGGLLHPAGDKSEIFSFRSAESELILQRSGDFRLLGEDEQARRFAVETMDHQRTPVSTEVARDFVNQRAAFLVLGGDGQDAGLLVDDNQIVVLKDDFE